MTDSVSAPADHKDDPSPPPGTISDPELGRFLPPRHEGQPQMHTTPPSPSGEQPRTGVPTEPRPTGSHPAVPLQPLPPEPGPTTTASAAAVGNLGELLSGAAMAPPPRHQEILELRQIAGLTAGSVIPLDQPSFAFAEGDNEIGFRIEVQDSGRVDVIPGAGAIAIDAIPVTGPTSIGLGALDVGSARFVVRSPHRGPGDWPDERELARADSSVIRVPRGLNPPEAEGTGRKRRRRSQQNPTALDAASWEFIETIRETRGETADRARLLHPDPGDLVARARYGTAALGNRRRGEARFAEIGVLCADISWMPTFDDISAVPEALGSHLQPLMSLPSVPIVANLLIGPLGITGPRRAVLACARHIMLSLYGLSSDELLLHAVTDPGRFENWTWSSLIAPPDRIDARFGYPVLIVDGAHNFPGATRVDHQMVMDGRVGLVVLADTVEQLPPYCGTVLQVDRVGRGLLTNHRGQVISGTPVGVTEATAVEITTDLIRALAHRR